ncbi:HTH-type transcriptional regulator LeuO [Pluralibacter gergoviae]|nr:HTH-type transcriptional regulator LeuO [Pluralibacter gergoviae]
MRLFLWNVTPSFSQPWYDTQEKQAAIAYQGAALSSVLNVVSQTHLVAIAPRWLAESCIDSLNIKLLPLPLKLNSRTCFLSWYEAAGHNKGHQWMKSLLNTVCSG